MADRWLNEYAEGHTGMINIMLHWACSPVLIASIIGLLWSLPVPAVFRESAAVLNWGTIFLMAIVVYYFIISISLALGMLPLVFGLVAGIAWMTRLDTPLWQISFAGMAIAALGQYIGHLSEDGNASLMRDLHYAAIAPLWMLAALYRKLGIPY
jgi:uncharacterized membrane protein YGL010W